MTNEFTVYTGEQIFYDETWWRNVGGYVLEMAYG